MRMPLQIDTPIMERLAGTAVIVAAVAATAIVMWRRNSSWHSVAQETARVRDLYDGEASRYDTIVRIPERLLFPGGRAWATSRAVGNVLEIAIGTGRNLPYYGPDLRLSGVEISPAMLQIARARARALGRDVALHVGDAQQLPYASERFDSVVSTLSMCTIPDERGALQEALRVLRPGGRLILLEHVRSTNPLMRLVQQLLEPLTIRYAGDHLTRDPLDHLGELGFVVVQYERDHAGLVERVVAWKPGAPTGANASAGDRHKPSESLSSC